MSLSQKILWAEGIFMGPQHFQQWEAYQQQQLQQQLSQFAVERWGLYGLEVDEAALENGKLVIRKCMAQFQDGEIIEYDHRQGVILALELDPSKLSDEVIHLCVPKYASAAGISGYKTLKAPSKWQADYKMLPDTHDPEREREVLVGMASLVLLAESELTENYYSLPLVKLRHLGGVSFELDKSFIPAVACLGASERIQQIIADQIQLLRTKFNSLREQREGYGGNIVEFGHDDISHFSLLIEFSRVLPQLELLAAQKDLHPIGYFQLLSTLCAVLIAFSRKVVHSHLPSYEHNNLSQTFERLHHNLAVLIEEVMPSKLQGIRLSKQSDTLYIAEPIDSQLLKDTSIYLAVRFEAERNTWVERFMSQIKVGAADAIHDIVASALPGCRIEYLQRPPSRLPIKAGYEYFAVDQHSEYWSQIKSTRSIGVFIPYEFIQAKFDLITMQAVS